MAVRLHAVLGTLMLLMGAAGGVVAQPAFSPEAGDALPSGEGRTYLDLLRLVVPGMAVSGSTYSEGRQPSGIRHIEAGDDGDVGLAPAGYLGLRAVTLRSGGMERLALLADFGTTDYSAGYAILALFDIAGEPRLLDAADVASGRWTSFFEPARFPVSAGNDLLVIWSTHHNSSQGYATAILILVRDGRFELVDAISMLSDKDCAFERSQSLAVEQGAGKPFADVAATVTERTVLTSEACGSRAVPEAASRAISATYRWDTAAQRYRPDSDAFERLARENEKRF